MLLLSVRFPIEEEFRRPTFKWIRGLCMSRAKRTCFVLHQYIFISMTYFKGKQSNSDITHIVQLMNNVFHKGPNLAQFISA